MTPYQRGNRDGLLSFAKMLDARASAVADAIDKYNTILAGPPEPSPARRTAIERLMSADWRSYTAYLNAARMARAAAEALPDDPEVPLDSDSGSNPGHRPGS